MATRLTRFVSAQPDTPFFVWQAHVYVQSFLDHGVEPGDITVLFGIDPAREPSGELEALCNRFPEVDLRLVGDTRDERGRAYPASIQPHLHEKWLREVPGAADSPVFYHDGDIALRRLPDFDAMFAEHPRACLLSDSRSYIGYEYLHGVSEKIRGELPSLSEDDLIHRMCAIVGLDPATVRDREACSGGAQYLLSGVGPDYWAKVYDDSLRLWELFSEYAEEVGLEGELGDYLQVWTAGMWAYLWNLWAAGHETAIHPELAFLFGAADLDDHAPILHMAGMTTDEQPGRFDKTDWRERNPIETVVVQPYVFDHHEPGSVAETYAAAIRSAAGVEPPPTGNGTLEPASEWRLLTWSAGPHRDVWDVERVHFAFDGDPEIVERISSGCAGEGFEVDHAFADDAAFWGGRANARSGCRPELYLGVSLDSPAAPTMVTLTHSTSEHRARLVMLQRCDGGDWSTALVAELAPGLRTHTIVYRPTGAETAPMWQLHAPGSSSGFAWDVTRLQLLHHDTEQSAQLTSSGDALPELGVDNVTRKDGLWGGRPDAEGAFHLTAADPDGVTLDRIVLDQGSEHWVDSLTLRRIDGGPRWTEVRRFDGLQPGRNELHLHELPPAPAPRTAAEPPSAAPETVRVPFRPAASFVRNDDLFADHRILVLIASYRDPDVANTVASALAQAAYPEHVRFAICDQFDEFTQGVLDPWSDDPRFSIDSVDHRESKGCGWARSRTFRLHDDEPYVLQIDAHTRFAARWDVRYIDMLESIAVEKPLLTTYPPHFTIGDDGAISYDLDAGVQVLYVDEVTDDLTTLQKTDVLHDLSVPGRSPTLAAGQIFTRGSFCRDVPYDPGIYFAGEEISLAARAFTHGYDLYCPNENLIWHLYDHGRPKHWDDHDDHRDANRSTAERLQQLFRGPPDALGEYGLGQVRSLAEFERRAGIRLRDDGGHRFEIDRSVIEPRDDYGAFVLVFLDAQGAEIARTEVRDPAVLDLSRPHVMLRDAPVADAVSYLVVPTQRNGTIGEVVLRPL